MGALKIARLLPGWGPEAKGCGQGLAPEDVSTPGLGQGEGPVGYKLSRSDDAGDDGRGRSGGRSRRPERSSSGARSLPAPARTGCQVQQHPLIIIICGGNMPLDGVEWWWGPQVATWGAHLRTSPAPQWRQIKVGSAGVFEQGAGWRSGGNARSIFAVRRNCLLDR